MSMFRQLWLAIIASTLMALAGSLLVSMLSARSYLESQLSIKNTDNATALALSLSQSNPDDVTVELVVASLFDGGHYELVRVTNPQGKTISERLGSDTDLGAPTWFVQLLPIRAQSGQAQISSGWKQFGTVTLVSQSRFAYAALWKSAQEMVVALTLAGLAGGYMATLVLRRLRRPLNAVIDQAQAITERRFVTMEEPAVPELKKLAQAMNVTVARLKAMFDDEAKRLEGVRREANCDTLTGLANRSNFMARLRDMVQAEHSAGGSVFIARVANLATVNQSLGRKDTDELLRAFARGLLSVSARYPEALAARLNGADFAMLVPALDAPQRVAADLFSALTKEAQAYLPNSPSTWLGCGNFPPGVEMETILAQVDLALAAVEADGASGLKVVDLHVGDDAPKSTEVWSRLIHRALEQKWVRLVSFPVMSLDGRLVHRECPLRLMFDERGEWQPAGKFLPVAERLKLTPQLDLAAVSLGLDELEAKPELTGLAINLSASSIYLPEFRSDLQRLLKRRSGTSRLWLEVAESGALSHFDAFKALCVDLRGVGCKLGLEHFGRQFSEIGRLHDLGLDYIKVDGSFVRGLDGNVGNQAFLKGLSTIAHSIGLKVIAEGVTSEADLMALGPVGFDGATGPAVNEPR
ncbi:EAL domain-containing protein [Rhodoferax sp. AJA081-3]|uniref:bifunctional diguanylate cyclase/phosphodiesterase n=1 Tax=Rhodoferax sp. AJA081-3 TaxID=2752316 RepID=UPI001AE06548|nr:EAL domain-containing protein [Rhodoferax sp. AJA081-3]QTN26886.1 EAL domain-containing protein [Rhodoferax sp. AJA081-3]